MREAQPYQLPVTILIDTMRDLHATVALHAHIASLPEGWNEACLAELIMVQGAIQTCTIRTTEGHLLLQQEAAFHMLERLGKLEWTLHVSFPSEPYHHAAQMDTPLSTKEPSWKTASPMVPAMLGILSHRQRHVLLLTENQKCPQEIAHLLGVSLFQVEQILEQLASHHMIVRHDERKRG